MKKKHKCSVETREKLRLAQLGRKHSEKTREKIRVKNKGKRHNAETKEKQRLVHLGKIHNAETREKLRLTHLGKKCNEKTKEKITKYHNQPEAKERRRLAWLGPLNPSWKGGVTKWMELFRKTPLYQEFCKVVYKRDNHTCQLCDTTDCLVHAHHTYSIRDFPLWSLLPDNGVCLCPKCHHTLEGKLHKEDRCWININYNLLGWRMLCA